LLAPAAMCLWLALAPGSILADMSLSGRRVGVVGAGVEAYLARWGLTGAREIAATSRATLYRVDGGRVLKVFTGEGLAHEGAHGTQALIHWAGRGAVRLIRHDAGAQLLEHLPGPQLDALPDDAATPVIVDVVRALHAAPGPAPPGMPDLRAHLANLFSAPDFAQAKAVTENLIATTRPEDLRVLHGDLHHENIMRGADGVWRAIDPKGLVGDRHYDVANVFCNPTEALAQDPARAARLADAFAAGLGMDRARVLRFAYVHACASACWFRENGYGTERDVLTIAMLERIAGL
jgi:streptomycin 6-kinase